MKRTVAAVLVLFFLGCLACEEYTPDDSGETASQERWSLVSTCPADLSEDLEVGMADLVMLLAAWGDCPGCVEDLDGGGAVGMADLTLMLGAWGVCEDEPPPPPAGCGDGVYDAGEEECDDGERFSGNGCSSACRIEAGWSCVLDGEISLCRPTNGTTYYVDIESRGGQCSDSYAGTDPSKPWCHLATTRYKLNAGDLVLVRGGIYREQLNGSNHGTADRYIVYKGYPGDGRPVIDGAGPHWAVSFDHASYVRLDGFEIRYGTGDGVKAQGGHHYTIVNNFIHHNHNDGLSLCGDFVLEGNIIGTHAFLGSHNDAFQTVCAEGRVSKTAIIRNNISYDNGQEFIVDMTITDYVEVSGNLIFKAEESPGAIGTKAITVHSNPTVARIFGNTIYGCASGINIGNSPNSSFKVYNNILYDTTFTLQNYSQVEAKNNLLYKSPAWPHSHSWQINIDGVINWANCSGFVGTSFGQGNYCANPKFKNLAEFNFRLSEGSPAIDAAASNSATLFDLPADYLDLDFASRPQGDAIDIGAYEF